MHRRSFCSVETTLRFSMGVILFLSFSSSFFPPTEDTSAMGTGNLQHHTMVMGVHARQAIVVFHAESMYVNIQIKP